MNKKYVLALAIFFALVFIGATASVLVFVGASAVMKASPAPPAFNSSRWQVTEHQLGNEYLYASHVSLSDAGVVMTIPPNQRTGGEIKSVDTVGYGYYSAITRCSPSHYVLNAPIFLYEDNEDEIDIEVYYGAAASTWQASFSIYVLGEPTAHFVTDLSFDPSLDYHEYAINWTAHNVVFYIDGTRLFEAPDQQIPANGMHLYENAYTADWLDGLPQTQTQMFTKTIVEVPVGQ